MTLSKAHQFFFLRRNSNISTKASNLLLRKQLRLRLRTIPDIRQHFAQGISLTPKKKGATAQAEHQTPHNHFETHHCSRYYSITTSKPTTIPDHHPIQQNATMSSRGSSKTRGASRSRGRGSRSRSRSSNSQTTDVPTTLQEDLLARIEQLEVQLTAQDSPAPTSTSSLGKSTKLLDLLVFIGGIDSPAFNTWKIQMNGKLKTNADHYMDEEACMHYVFSRTRGDAQGHLEPQFKPDVDEPFQTANSMIRHLASIYKDLFQVKNARRDYHKLMMWPTKTFMDFYTRFLHLASEGQIPHEDLHLDLYDKLTLELQRAIALIEGTLNTLKDLQKAVLHLDQNLHQIHDRTDHQIKVYSTLSNSPSLEKTTKTLGVLPMKLLSVSVVLS